MALFFSYLGFIRSDQKLVEKLQCVDRLYANGDFEAVEDVFHSIEANFGNDEKYKIELANYLLKTGQYTKILEIDMQTRTGQIIQEDAKRCIDKLKSNNLHSIASLIDLSPNSFQVVMAAAQVSLQNSNYGRFKAYNEKARYLRKDSSEPEKMLAHYYLLVGQFEEGIKSLRSAGLGQLANEYQSLYSSYRSIVAESNPSYRFSNLKALYFQIKHRLIMDIFSPSIYNQLEIKVLEQLIQIGCDLKVQDIHKFSERLVSISPTEISMFLNVKAHASVGLVKEARDLLNEYRNKLGDVRFKTLDSFISLIQRNIQERERQEKERLEKERQERERQERERQRREQHNRRNMQSQNTPKAGQDFLEYYKTLGIDSKANPKEIKKAHRNKVKKIGLAANTDKAKGEELKRVNKAYQILSDENSKRLYDQGINPENPQDAAGQHGRSFRGESIFIDDDVNEILKSFFGGGGSRRGHYRTQFFYY